jgi:hypothetical protein
VTALVGECAASIQGVLKVSAIQKMMQDRHSIEISEQQVKRLLKLKLGYSYRRISAVTATMNSTRCKEERKRAASEFIITLSQPHRVIINIDETIVRTTYDAKYCWQRKGISNIVTGGMRMNAVSLIMAISNKGDIYFTANRGSNNGMTIQLFLQKLTAVLDAKDRNWRDYTTLLMDNAPYHRGRIFTENVVSRMLLPIAYLGPYQFKMAPVELVFAYIKKFDLNPSGRKANTV